jgi:hypothetical protein
MGCGCGFAYSRPGSRAEQHQPTFNADGRISVRALRDYLWEVVQDGDVELYATWLDEEDMEPATRAHVTPDAFGGPSFRFHMHAFFTVSRSLPPDAPEQWPIEVKGISMRWTREEFEQNLPPWRRSRREQ